MSFSPLLPVHISSWIPIGRHGTVRLPCLAGGHYASRTGAEGCVGVGGIGFFGWGFARGGVFMAPESVDVYL